MDWNPNFRRKHFVFCRKIGDDVNVDELVLEKNVSLGPAEVGLLATVGLQTVRVYDKPRVVVLSTGNEVSFEGNEELISRKFLANANRCSIDR